MSALLIGHTNRIDTATLTAGAWSTAFPLANLKDAKLGKVARTTNAKLASTRFRGTFTQNRLTRALALVNHNLSTSARWRVRTGRASLDLDFTSGAVDERITYTGGANGTKVGPSGLVEPAAYSNSILHSEDFTNAAWVLTGLTVTGNSTTAPDNALTADTLTTSTASAEHKVVQPSSPLVSSVLARTVYAKAGSASFLGVSVGGAAAYAVFDLTLGTITASVACVPSIRATANGFYELKVDGITAAGDSIGFHIGETAAQAIPATVYTGTSKTVILWGAQLHNRLYAREYIPTVGATVSVAAPRQDFDPRNRVTNLLKYSEDFANPVWASTIGGTGTAVVRTSGFIAPDGTPTAWRLQASIGAGATASDFSLLRQLISGGSGGAIWAKSNTSASQGVLMFSYSANVIKTVSTAWQFLESVTLPSAFDIGIRGDGVGVSKTIDILIWHPQAETTSKVGSYIPTTAAAASAYQDFGPIRTNLLSRSQEFEHAAWVKTSVTVTANTDAAPDGFTTGDTLTAGAADSFTSQTLNTRIGATYTFSVYLKAGTASALRIYLGTAFTACTLTASFTRFTVSFVATATTTVAQIGGAASFGAGNVKAWGAQLEEGSAATDYIQSFHTANTSPEGCRGLLIEEARTSLGVYSEQLDNAAYVKAELTVTANPGVAPDGVSSADRLTLSTVATVVHSINQAIATTAAAHTLSCYLKYETQRYVTLFPQGTNTGAAIFDLQTGAITATGGSHYLNSTIEQAGNGWYRCSVSWTAAAVTTNCFVYSTNTAVDLAPAYTAASETWLMWGFQLEQGAFPTSYIPTVATPVTRTVDDARITGTAFTDAYNFAAGTLYAEAGKNPGPANARYFAVTNAGSTEALEFYQPDANNAGAIGTTGGAIQFQIFRPPTTAPIIKMALSCRKDDITFVVHGNEPVRDSAANMPTPTMFLLGAYAATTGFSLNNRIKRAVYWPEKLTDAELQTITTSGPDAIGYSSGWLNVLQMSFKGDVPTSWGSQYQAAVAYAETTTRYLTVEIDDQNNASGYIQAGLAFCSGAFQPAMGASFGLTSGRVDLSEVIVSQSGAMTGTARRRQRTETFAVKYMTQAEADRIHELQAEVGIVDAVLYIPDPADMPYSQRYGFLGYIKELDALEYPIPLRRSIGFGLKEQLP